MLDIKTQVWMNRIPDPPSKNSRIKGLFKKSGEFWNQSSNIKAAPKLERKPVALVKVLNSSMMCKLVF